MGLQQTSLAAAVGAAVKNEQFQPSALNVPRKILIMAIDGTTPATAPIEPVQVFSPEDTAVKFGSGKMAHRMAIKAFQGSEGVPCFVSVDGVSGAIAADGSITFTGPSTAAGSIYLYVAGDRVAVPVAKGATDAIMKADVIAAVNANTKLPLIASAGAGAGQVDLDSKSVGLWGNDIDVSLNLGLNEDLPAGTGATILALTGGVGSPNLTNILDGLGTGDSKNEKFFTDVVHGFMQDTAVMDTISLYNGVGNDFVGLYSKIVHRPFRLLMGDTEPGVSGAVPAGLIVITDARKTDRTNGIICVPGSPNHPAEIAAQAMGGMAKINNDIAAQSYIGFILAGIIPGAIADRWTNFYDSRDAAVKAGLSPTTVEGGAVTMSNVLTFYRPDSVPVDSNGYRSMRNISILQNILFNTALNFGQEKWKGIFIVADTTKVSNPTDRQKARDVSSVLDDWIALATSFEGHGWIFTAGFTIAELAKGDKITIRPGGIGFDSNVSVLLSGEGGILDNVVKFDTALGILLA
ncbi:MAG: hypothetical protein ACTSPB_12900 [Candidatus Thorarchaeota archaeon]